MYPNYYVRNDNRQAFVLPFLVGAVTGGAAVGLTRPRPIVNYPNYNYRPYPYYYGGGPAYYQYYY